MNVNFFFTPNKCNFHLFFVSRTVFLSISFRTRCQWTITNACFYIFSLNKMNVIYFDTGACVVSISHSSIFKLPKFVWRTMLNYYADFKSKHPSLKLFFFYWKQNGMKSVTRRATKKKHDNGTHQTIHIHKHISYWYGIQGLPLTKSNIVNPSYFSLHVTGFKQCPQFFLSLPPWTNLDNDDNRLYILARKNYCNCFVLAKNKRFSYVREKKKTKGVKYTWNMVLSQFSFVAVEWREPKKKRHFYHAILF